MNRRLIKRWMQQKTNLLSSSASYYFRPDFENVLQGLCIEYTPRGVYVSTLCFPLFDFFGINLTFSKRIEHQGGFIADGSMTEEAAVDFLLSSPEVTKLIACDKTIELSEFISGMELLPYDWQRTRIAPIYLAAKLLQGQDVRTTALFKTFPAASVLGSSDMSAWKRLQEKLQIGLEPAKTLLEQVRYENMQKLSLPHSPSAA